MPEPPAVLQVGDALSATDKKVVSVIVEKATYFKKVNSLYAVFFVSTLIALIIMKMPDIVRIIFKEEDPDSNFEEEDGDLKKRWRRIIIYTLFFIIVIVIVHVFVLFIIAAGFIAKEGDVDRGLSSFYSFVWEFEEGGKPVKLTGYYALMCLVLVGLFLFYMIYTILVKGYFRNIYYERVNRKDPEAEDLLQPQKYLYRYAIFLSLMMLFILLLINYGQLSDFKEILIYNFVIILLYVILVVNVIRFQMQGNIVKFIINLLLFIIAIVIYQFPLRLLIERAV